MAGMLSVKEHALLILHRQLAARVAKRQQGIVAQSSATNPYLPAEEKEMLIRQILGLLLEYQFRILIITKSPPRSRKS
ncbi:hypothetical protein HGH93_03920 [Chitinophaga polysaccharea]|uniref:hypothetical protein n=1 Tax=Chitinophaga polysaccharea TaxID=1293035 RepID=UPI001455251B|nr:hypothetical protein [Chitinophaga polysaccharea]NLR57229.1 hypothetical protein [Chitinophaga polysaccharea]